MALFGSIATMQAQAPRTAGFPGAFAYVEDLCRAGSEARRRIAAMGVGESKKIELAGGMFAIEQVYETKPRAEGFFESHRKYIDLQVLVEGEELMEVIDAGRMTVRQGYDAERDLIIYADSAEASRLRIAAGEAAVFFPVDAHMPTLRTGAGAARVRKTVVKIPVA